MLRAENPATQQYPGNIASSYPLLKCLTAQALLRSFIDLPTTGEGDGM